jgi:oligopeptide/dipeptide ABC transporter ATP-binding protein
LIADGRWRIRSANTPALFQALASLESGVLGCLSRSAGQPIWPYNYKPRIAIGLRLQTLVQPARMNDPASAKPRLSVRHLSVQFRPRGMLPGLRRGHILALDDLHIDVRHGETIGFVGESGCGKTVLARALAGLQKSITGSIRCDGEELRATAKKDTSLLRHPIQLIEENPFADFKTRRKIGDIIGEALRLQTPKLDTQARDAHVAALLARVGLPDELAQKTLKALTAPERARLALARALGAQPKVLLCDAPAAQLDDEAREAFIELVVDVAQQMDLALLLFAQEPTALRPYCSRLLTMTLGKVMEQAPTDALLDAPRHPYTRALLERAAISEQSPLATHKKRAAKSAAPALQHPPMGCVFHPRCPLAESACVRSEPHLRRVGPEHYAACHFVGDGSQS